MCRMWANSVFGFWNTVTFTGEHIDAHALVDQLNRAAAFMRSQSQAGYLWLFEELLDSSARAQLDLRMRAAGLEISFTGHGMAGD